MLWKIEKEPTGIGSRWHNKASGQSGKILDIMVKVTGKLWRKLKSFKDIGAVKTGNLIKNSMQIVIFVQIVSDACF